MTTLLDRYNAGEQLRVYAELVGQPKHPEASAVAEEIMKRVRQNLETLAERWREHGFELAAPIGQPGASTEHLAEIEEACGKLPATLRAFYEQIGEVSFVEEPPDDEWPGTEELDPIQVFGLEDQLERLTDDGSEQQLLICNDHLIKFDIGGVGPIYVPLPAKGFDPTLHFEGDEVNDLLGPRFVEYLRIAILERGGIGPAGGDPPRNLVRALVKDLIPF